LGFEEPFGSKYQEKEKCPSFRKKVEREHENGTLGNVQGNDLGD